MISTLWTGGLVVACLDLVSRQETCVDQRLEDRRGASLIFEDR